MKYINITKGKRVLVDDDDFKFLNQWHWYWHTGYAARRLNLGINKSKILLMHRALLSVPENKEVDHINGDRLDNRKANLRIVSHQENMQNMKKRVNSTSKFRGVSFHKGAWDVQLWNNGKHIYIGRFKDEIQAAKIADSESIKLFGKLAKLNFP